MRSQLSLMFLLSGCVDPVTGSASQASTVAPAITLQTSGTTARLQSIAPVNDRVAWIAGTAGTVLRTTDGGATWVPRPVPGAEALAFRDIHAVDADTAFVLTNNGGPSARIYKTTDAGATWTLHFQSPIDNTFYDCFAFWSPRRAVAFPDAENGRFDAIRMTDGDTWTNIGDAVGPAQPGEGLFPTSGNCVTTLGARQAWAVIAGASPSRVLATDDGGDTWTSYPIPIAGAATGGGMNVLFRDQRHGIVAGGDVAGPTVQQDNVARSSDGGQTWELATPAPFPGAVYGLAYVPHHGHHHSGNDGHDGHDGHDDHDGHDGHGRYGDRDALEARTARNRRDDLDGFGDRDADARIARDRRDHRDHREDGDRHGNDSDCDHDDRDYAIIATGPGGAAWSPDEGDSWTPLPDLTAYFAVELASSRTGWMVGSLGKIARIDF